MILGINEISNEDYHRDREFESSSSLKLFLFDPKSYYKKYVLQEREDDKEKTAFIFGSYIHSCILEPSKTTSEFVVYEGAKRYGKKYEKFKEENPKKQILTEIEAAKADWMIEKFANHAVAPNLIANGQAEKTLCVEIDGIKIKVRADYVTDNAIHDIKTTYSGLDKENVLTTILKYNYDLSAALYVDAFTQWTGREHSFNFIFMNKKDGSIEVYRASDELIANGRRKYKKSLKNLAKARESGIYYQEGIQEITIPPFLEFEQ
ncbi:MAG: hypothetical protein CMG00_06010 [Candidatus Marinimicrobia bacterium]|nr:hypothetical protein [Candidatus Neomarinimicrobiota bacterium]|tara:strand:+ start:6195 stop:6983 length:789 start_codon:yes stop_codon:yes gene_type:complete